MNYIEFCERVKTEIASMISEENSERVILDDVIKNNGMVYKGLIVIDSVLNISPTIYLDPYYYKYVDGADFTDILYDIVETINENKPKENFDVETVKNWDTAKEYLICKLINYEKNKVLLEGVPHKKVEDLAIVYMVSVEAFMGEYATVLVNNKMFDLYNVPFEEFDKVANDNLNKISPYYFEDMETTLSQLVDAPLPSMPGFNMYVVSNSKKIHGAISILNSEVQDKIGEILGDKCYVIPSSIHEVLVVPYDIDYTFEDFNEMIAEVNETQLTNDEILSDYVYVLDTKNHVFLRADREVEYERELQLKAQKEKEIIKELEKKKDEPAIGPKL